MARTSKKFQTTTSAAALLASATPKAPSADLFAEFQAFLAFKAQAGAGAVAAAHVVPAIPSEVAGLKVSKSKAGGHYVGDFRHDQLMLIAGWSQAQLAEVRAFASAESTRRMVAPKLTKEQQEIAKLEAKLAALKAK